MFFVNKHPYSIKHPHSAKHPYSNIITLEYGYLSTKVHPPLIAHKHTVMPHYKTRILLTGSPNPTLKIPHKKAFIYGIDVSDTVKAIGLEID